MEIIGSVPAEEVPEGRTMRIGVWSSLAGRIIEEYKAGRVVVVKVKDQKELVQMRNGTHEKMRKAGWVLRPVVVEEEDGLKAFLNIERRPDAEPPPAPLLTTGMRRGRLRTNSH